MPSYKSAWIQLKSAYILKCAFIEKYLLKYPLQDVPTYVHCTSYIPGKIV